MPDIRGGSAQIADGSVTSAKIADGTIATADLAFTPIQSGVAIASGELRSSDSAYVSSTGGGSVYLRDITTGTTLLLEGANGRVSFPGGATLDLANNTNISSGTTTGAKICTGTTQKLGFHNSTPVAQRAGAAQAAVAATAATSVTPFGFTTAAQADALVTLVNELRAALVEKGLIKGSA